MRNALALVLLAGLIPAAGHADSSALWRIVNDKCVPHQEAAHDPAPCTAVDLTAGVEKGHVLLKDLVGVAQYLLIPTAKVTGIEDPQIIAPGAPNYWAPSWQARALVDDRLKTTLPRDGYALAINSAYGRTQNQLHIHIDCIRPDVREAVVSRLGEVGPTWAPFPVKLAGSPYQAIRIDGEVLTVDPFRVLADGNPQAAADMGRHTLVLIGATFPDGAAGFVLLDGQASVLPPDPGSGERLEDHDCTIVRR